MVQQAVVVTAAMEAAMEEQALVVVVVVEEEEEEEEEEEADVSVVKMIPKEDKKVVAEAVVAPLAEGVEPPQLLILAR
jgi:hypothetical protein